MFKKQKKTIFKIEAIKNNGFLPQENELKEYNTIFYLINIDLI